MLRFVVRCVVRCALFDVLFGADCSLLLVVCSCFFHCPMAVGGRLLRLVCCVVCGVSSWVVVC